jgi:hypothetical protein
MFATGNQRGQCMPKSKSAEVEKLTVEIAALRRTIEQQQSMISAVHHANTSIAEAIFNQIDRAGKELVVNSLIRSVTVSEERASAKDAEARRMLHTLLREFVSRTLVENAAGTTH